MTSSIFETSFIFMFYFHVLFSYFIFIRFIFYTFYFHTYLSLYCKIRELGEELLRAQYKPQEGVHGGPRWGPNQTMTQRVCWGCGDWYISFTAPHMHRNYRRHQKKCRLLKCSKQPARTAAELISQRQKNLEGECRALGPPVSGSPRKLRPRSIARRAPRTPRRNGRHTIGTYVDTKTNVSG